MQIAYFVFLRRKLSGKGIVCPVLNKSCAKRGALPHSTRKRGQFPGLPSSLPSFLPLQLQSIRLAHRLPPPAPGRGHACEAAISRPVRRASCLAVWVRRVRSERAARLYRLRDFDPRIVKHRIKSQSDSPRRERN